MTDYNFNIPLPTKTELGLGDVDNTSDINKPVSNAQSTAIGLKEDASNKSVLTSESASTTKFPVWSAIVSYFSASQIRSILGISTLSGSNTGDQDLSGLISQNSPITGATKTKLTYDSKGLVTSGADATTADVGPSTDRNYLTDANQTKVNAIDQSVSSTEKSTWNGKQNNLGFTPLSVTNNLSDLDDPDVAKGNLSLENVNNTSDASKPISTATQTALDLKVDKADVMQSIRTASTNENITAGYSGIVVRKFRINSGVKLIINTGSTFRIL